MTLRMFTLRSRDIFGSGVTGIRPSVPFSCRGRVFHRPAHLCGNFSKSQVFFQSRTIFRRQRREDGLQFGNAAWAGGDQGMQQPLRHRTGVEPVS